MTFNVADDCVRLKMGEDITELFWMCIQIYVDGRSYVCARKHVLVEEMSQYGHSGDPIT